jgi:hypothetical protein
MIPVIVNRDKLMAEDDIHRLFEKRALTLPPDYIRFLLNVGGGEPRPDFIPCHPVDGRGVRYVHIHRLLSAKGALALRAEHVRDRVMDNPLLPVAQGVEDDYVLLDCSGASAVYVWNDLEGDYQVAKESGHVTKVADTFTEFLASFTYPPDAMPWAEWIYENNVDAIRDWLTAGGDANAQSENLGTIINVARRFHRGAIKKLLKTHGAKE